MNPLKQLGEYGQAVWLDDIHRDLMTSGRLKRMIEDDGLRGITSNPAIFQKAISDSEDYEDEIHELAEQDHSAGEILETLSVHDVQMAADEFQGLHRQSNGEHGYVSLEVNPHLARDTDATIEEGRRLWKAVDRPNVFIKVPGTREGLPAIEQLISEGMNINVTLLFGLPRYREVAHAFIVGLEKRLGRGKSVKDVRSVASFFLSRIDVLLDPQLEEIAGKDGEKAELAKKLRGQVAIASAQNAYMIYKEILASPRWKKLAEQQAHPQWLLWASTSTKNPDYSDVKYVEALIGPETVNTMPMDTLDAYRDHGQPALRLQQGIEAAPMSLEQLKEVGIDIDQATGRLEEEGIEKFCKPFDQLLKTLKQEITAA